MLAVDLGIPPNALWRADPVDLATMVDVIEERARTMRRKGRR